MLSLSSLLLWAPPTAYRTPYHFGNFLIGKALRPIGSPKFPLNSFPAYRPWYPGENLSCLCLSLPIDCWLRPITKGSPFSIYFVTRLHIGSLSLRSARSSLPPIVEFVRQLRYYRLLCNIAPQTTSPIDIYDEKHFSVPKNSKSLTWHATMSKVF